LVLNGGTETANDARKFAGAAIHGIKSLLINVSDILSNIKLRANFGTGCFCDNEKLMKFSPVSRV